MDWIWILCVKICVCLEHIHLLNQTTEKASIYIFLKWVDCWIGFIWATSWENLFMPYANNKGADQPVHLRSLISTFVVRYLHSIMSLVYISEIISYLLWLRRPVWVLPCRKPRRQVFSWQGSYVKRSYFKNCYKWEIMVQEMNSIACFSGIYHYNVVFH